MELVLSGVRPTGTGAFLNFGTGPDTLLIDASRLEFGCPLDLAGMLATAHWATSGMLPVTFKLPADPDVASYLQRMDVLRQMPEKTQFVGRLPTDARTGLGRRLLEATPLNAGNVNDVAERLGHLVSDYYAPLSATAGKRVFRACGELLDNAVEHGESPAGAFVAVQAYTGKTTGRPRLELAICDTGIGVLQHLHRNAAYSYLTNDQAALKLAIVQGVSGSGTDRGNGLSDVIQDTRHHGYVWFQMRSGAGEMTVVGSAQRCEVKTAPRPDRTNGTWAWLTHTMRSPE